MNMLDTWYGEKAIFDTALPQRADELHCRLEGDDLVLLSMDQKRWRSYSLFDGIIK